MERDAEGYIGGAFDAAKCVRYLRAIGADVTHGLAQSFADAEKAHRFLTSMKRAKEYGEDRWCASGHQWFTIRRTGDRKAVREALAICPHCGLPGPRMATRWIRALDGSLRDYRAPEERWRDLNYQPSESADA